MFITEIFKAGTYYVGDLCYILNDQEWDELCSLTLDGSEVKDGIFKFKDGRQFAIFSTAYGDGDYKDFEGRRYGVDAGAIGCIAMDGVPEGPYRGGNIIKYNLDFVCSGEKGLIRMGGVRIDTRGEYNEESGTGT